MVVLLWLLFQITKPMENAVKYYSENIADEAIILWNASSSTLFSSWTLSNEDQINGNFISDKEGRYEIICPPNLHFIQPLSSDLVEKESPLLWLVQKICDQWANTGNIGDITDFPIFGGSEWTLG